MDPDGITLNIALSLIFFVLGIFCAPLFWLVLKKLGITRDDEVTQDDVKSMMDVAGVNELIDLDQKEMIDNIFELDDVTVFDVMTHRTELCAVDENLQLWQVIELARDEGFSRLPVYGKNLDNIVGIVYIKDLLFVFSDREAAGRLVKDSMRSCMFVPKACKAKQLLIDFKLKHTQVAVVVDEYGGTSGIVTMEDILEEIVGDIVDEFDDEEDLIVPFEDGFLVDGSLQLEDIFERFEQDMPEKQEDEDFETIGGFITERLGRIPTQQEEISISYGQLIFDVMETTERRVVKVKVRLQLQKESHE